MSTVLVLGASGFLGRHVVDVLADPAAGLRVVTAGRDVCDLVHDPVRRVEQVVREVAPEVVVNCTGRLDGRTHELVEANTLVTAKLLDALTEVPARLVRIGSAGEYGVVPTGHAVSEDVPARPVGPYGASHLAATQLVEQARRSGRVDAVTLRVFNPIGRGLNGDTVLGRAARRIRDAMSAGDHRRLVVHLGSLDVHRDFVDARDVARAVLAAVSTASPWPTINIGSGRATHVRAAVRLLADVAGYDGEIVEAPTSPARSAGVTWIRADVSRALDAFGWKPHHDLTDSLQEIWHDVAATRRDPVTTRAEDRPLVIATTEERTAR